MDGSKLNRLLAQMRPDEIELIPRAVRVWRRAGWMDEAEADQWRLGAMAWAEYHDISPESDAT